MSGYAEKARWTAKQVNFLVNNWDTMKDQAIADVLGRSLKSVRRKREELELHKQEGKGKVGRQSDQFKEWAEKGIKNKRNGLLREDPS